MLLCPESHYQLLGLVIHLWLQLTELLHPQQIMSPQCRRRRGAGLGQGGQGREQQAGGQQGGYPATSLGLHLLTLPHLHPAAYYFAVLPQLPGRRAGVKPDVGD